MSTSSTSENAERRGGIYTLLQRSQIYMLVQRAVGGDRSWRRYIDRIGLRAGDEVLDIGCGPGKIVEYLPRAVKYSGFDVNADYIEHAHRAYADRSNVEFFCESVSEATMRSPRYDVALASGLLHHLDDDEARQLFRIAHGALLSGGRLVTWDPVYVDGQPWLARRLIARDRGKYVRTPSQYLALARECFPETAVTSEIVDDLLRIPYTHFVMSCEKRV
jgi:SAM-dependent methyltransferase